MRHRLIPTRGVGRSRFTHGSTEEALAEARNMYELTGIPVLVVIHSEDSHVFEHVGVVPSRRERRAAERAQKKAAEAA